MRIRLRPLNVTFAPEMPERNDACNSVIANAHGLIGTVRGLSTTNVVSAIGVWGREAYQMSPEEPRPFTDNLIGPRDPSSSGSGAYFSYGPLVNVRVLLEAADAVSSMTEQEKEGVRAWAKTVAAFTYFQIARAYTEFGAPLEPPEDPVGDLAPIATSDELYDRSLQLFDEAFGHLQNAGSFFAFSLTPGYAGFDSPQTFGQLNRALKVRALKYRGRWDDVLSTLPETFIDPDGDLDLGVYHSYFAEDNTFNPFNDPRTSYVHPRIRDDAQLKANNEPDDRAISKTQSITPFTFEGVTVTEGPNMYPETTSPFPWIRNEELILIRAEARLATSDVPGALADVNEIRTRSGGLEPVAGLTGDALLTEILYNRLNSLLWEGAFAYWDAKQYDRLDQLPRARPSHVVFDRLNWTLNECTTRNMADGPCGPVSGL